MQIIDRGTGAPIVMIPGIQGRWEYMRPAIDALAESFRVITFPLCGERGKPPASQSDERIGRLRRPDRRSARRSPPDASDDLRRLLRRAHRASVRRAASRADLRARSGVATGTELPSPAASQDLRAAAANPRACLSRRGAAARPRRDRTRHSRSLGAPAVRVAPGRHLRCARPFSLSRMAARARLIGIHDQPADCARILAPTLVVTGEPSLDHVVSAEGTSEYQRLIRHARAVRLERTGHLGYITRPREFAAAVREFLASNSVDEGGLSTGASRVLSRDGRLECEQERCCVRSRGRPAPWRRCSKNQPPAPA